MNTKERAVLLFLIVVVVAGAGASAWRHYRLQRNLKAVRIEIVRDSALTPRTPDPLNPNPQTPGLPSPTPGPRPLTPTLDLNSASAAELDLLPGIGPALAQRIIEYREKHRGFKAVEELKQVSGIGPKKFDAIKNRVTAVRR